MAVSQAECSSSVMPINSIIKKSRQQHAEYRELAQRRTNTTIVAKAHSIKRLKAFDDQPNPNPKTVHRRHLINVINQTSVSNFASKYDKARAQRGMKTESVTDAEAPKQTGH